MTKVHIVYSETVVDVTGDVGQLAWGEKDPKILHTMVVELKKILVGTFDYQYKSGGYSPEYHLPGHVVEDIQRLGTLSVLNSSTVGK